MIFSHCTDRHSQSNRIAQVLEHLRNQKISLLDLTCSNPTQVNLFHRNDKFFHGFLNPHNGIYNPDARGLITAREAVARYYHDHSITVEPDDIVLTSGTSEAYSFLFHVLMNPGEAVCFPRPGYPLFEFLAEVNHISWKTYRLVYTDTGWALDRKIFLESLQNNIKAVTVVNPNNPTGSFLSEEDTDFLYDICREKQAAVICDEVFLDYPLDEKCMPGSLVNRKDHLTFVLGGLSKAFGLPQMKLSWIVVNGPPQQKHEALERLEMIADLYLSVNTPVQNALENWMAQREEIQQIIQTRIRANWDFLSRQTPGGVELLKARAGWYAVLKLSAHIEEEEFCLNLLKEDHVYVHPGYFFDFDPEPFIVVSLLPEEQVFQKGMQKILKRVKT